MNLILYLGYILFKIGIATRPQAIQCNLATEQNLNVNELKKVKKYKKNRKAQ